jgi:hypothetical protein
VQSEVAFELDDLGIVVAPMAELSEAEILGAFIVPRVEGDLPSGVPRDLATKLQGKRIDVAVAVDFLSEVFVENTPLARPVFEEQAQTLTLGGQELRRLEVLGPRLGYGTLLSTGKKHVFTSRKVADPVPADLVLRLLGEA